MVVPKTKEWEHAVNQETRDELDKLMSKYDWSREIDTVTIDYHPRTGPILNTYRCKASAISCNCEGKSSLIYLIRMPSGVIFTCQWCRRNTAGPITMDIFDKVSSRRITVTEAFEICDRENIMPPSGLDLAYPDRRRLEGRPRIIV